MKDKKTDLNLIYIITALLVLFVLQFILHRMTPFIKDDLWYMTNLVTGEKIASPTDIIESQIWHYFNWGGRIVNHALLQAVESTGELGADILNILATMVLGFIVCFLAKVKNPLYYLLAESLIISFNASIHFSMYWESGSANYLYSSCWILFYMAIVLKYLEKNVKKDKFIEIWIVPLSLIAGWSTENMGPTCFLLTVFILIFSYVKFKKLHIFLIEGALFSLAGSALMILAPGNFVRNQFVEKATLTEIIHKRFDVFLLSSCDFLLPTILFALIVLTAEIVVFKEKINIRDVAIFSCALLAQGAMFLSPAYPQRASFGIMCLLIAFIISGLNQIANEKNLPKHIQVILSAVVYIHAISVVIRDIVFLPF